MAVKFSLVFVLAVCCGCHGLQEPAPTVNPATSTPPLTPDQSNNSIITGTETNKQENSGCNCETKASESGNVISIIDYIFGGDDDDDYLDEDDDFGWPRSPASESVDLLYKRKRRNKNKNKNKPYELRERPNRKNKKKSKGSRPGKLTRISHRGHRHLKPELPCHPEKVTACFNFNNSGIPIACNSEVDFCIDDCDCPSFQKCCVNACGRRECLPSFHTPDESPVTGGPSPPAEAAGSEKTESSIPNENESHVTGTPGSEAPVPAAGETVPESTLPPIPTPAARF